MQSLERTQNYRMRISSSPARILAGVIVLAGAATLRADPVAELASFSVFNAVDLAQLKGEAKTQRGERMSNPRFLSVQSVWVSPGSPQELAAALRGFNPARHPEMHVLLHQNGNNFSSLGKLPAGAPVDWLRQATESRSKELQISQEEAAKSGAFADFWSAILSARAATGVFGQPSYSHTGSNLKPSEQINALLAQQPKLRKQFDGLIGDKGETYWELLEVERKGVLTLGASFNRTASGGAALQAADVLYYASGGYDAAITLYQMWPVTVDGKPATLVWRGDLISSSELAGLAGVERLGSESAMMKDVGRSIRFFRGDTGR